MGGPIQKGQEVKFFSDGLSGIRDYQDILGRAITNPSSGAYNDTIYFYFENNIIWDINGPL